MGTHLEGQVAVVTGGGRGIGRGIALALAQQGAHVVVADYGGTAVEVRVAGSSEPADQVVAEIVAAGCEAVACAEDVATMAGGRRVVEAALDNFGRLDGLVCCAGITVQKYFWELEEAEWDDVIAVHMKGHFSCAQAAAKVMMPQGSGRMVFISSGAFAGAPNLPSYGAAKAGVLAFTWSCAYALESYGINTNCVVPSAATRMSDSIYGGAGVLSDQVGETVRSELAGGTYRDPANIAPLVVYLMGDQARDINGQIFRIAGYQIDHMAGITYDRTMTNDAPWDLDTLIARFPEEMGTELKPPPVPWPVPKR